MDTTLIQVIVWLLMGFWGWHIGKGKNRPVAGILLGFLLGIIGVIIIACLKPKTLPPQE